MMNRILNVEFPALILVDDPTASSTKWVFDTDATTNYRPIDGTNDQYWVSEQKLDLSGYTMDDLTVYFRNSFEQRGSVEYMKWKINQVGRSLNPFEASVYETTVLTTVPMTDENLNSMVFMSPGFIPIPFSSSTIQFGNFNRTHIIHGTQLIHSLDTSFGSDTLDAPGGALTRIIQSNDFSSLEPTATENIYCYRVVYLPEAHDATENPNGLDTVFLAPKRVILNAYIDEEPQLEYMMRLKRGYELANQV